MRSRTILLLIVLLALAGGGYYGYGQYKAMQMAKAGPAAGAPPGGGRPPAPAPVLTVAPRSIPITREYAAILQSANSVDIRAKVTGFIIERNFTEGADVNKDDVLIRIDPRDYKATLDRVKAQNESDQAALTLARATAGRTTSLVNNQFASRDSFDRAQADVAKTQAAVNLSRAQIRQAELDLSYTEIRAPISGRMGQAKVDVGALVSAANTQLATLVQLDPIYVAFAPADSDIADIQARRAKGPLSISILQPTDGRVLATGLLDFVNNAVDASTSTITMRGTAPNPDKTLIPGQFVRVRLDLGVRDGALVVPQRAIASDQTGKSLAFVTADNRVEFRPVKLGAAVDATSQIVESGLNPGDRIIVEAVQKMFPGMPIQPVPVPAQ
ncbi:MAG: efflux RND transporter periplasmic adaptor subunit [Elsteraceae bacterium]